MKPYLLLLALAAMLTACTDNKFTLEGTVEGNKETTPLILETSSNGMWLIVDTAYTDAAGKFSISADAPQVPNIYRLRLGDEFICFPIDSLDHLTLTARAANFGSDYDITGSEHARMVMDIDKTSLKMATQLGSEAFRQWKDKLARQIVADPDGIVAYYAVNKNIEGTPLFDPTNDSDFRIIGAVANAFYTFRPADPRTDYLVGVLTRGQQLRRQAAAPSDTLVADIASIIDIKLQDYTGTTHRLADVATKNRMVILNFTIYDADFSPMFNKLLNDIYSVRHPQGLEIYQVSLDPDNVAWSQSARNLPWITVYEPMGQNAVSVGAYQVRGVPTSFVISRGEIVARVDDPEQLKATVNKYF